MGFVSGAPSGASIVLGAPLRVGLSAASPRGLWPLRAFRFYPWPSCPPGANTPPHAQPRWTIALKARRSPGLLPPAPALRLPAPPATMPTERRTFHQHKGRAHGRQDVRSCSPAPRFGARRWGERAPASLTPPPRAMPRLPPGVAHFVRLLPVPGPLLGLSAVAPAPPGAQRKRSSSVPASLARPRARQGLRYARIRTGCSPTAAALVWHRSGGRPCCGAPQPFGPLPSGSGRRACTSSVGTLPSPGPL